MDSKKLPTLKNYEFIHANGIPCNLGFGAYGSVMLGKSLKTGQTVAIKRIGRKMAIGEVEVHMKLNHPNIIKMLDFYFDQKNECTYIVLEYAQKGTLFEYIRQNGMKDKAMARTMFQSVCDAVDYLHAKSIMHRDIKPENILLDRKYVVKLCDFGFAVNCEPRMTMCGTVEYMSPEMILRKPYNHKIDIWGLGILFYEMIEGRAPFQGQTQDEVLEKMKKPLQFSKNFTADQIEFIQRVLRVNPNERPQIRQLLKSPCLKNINKNARDSEQTRDDQPKSPTQKKIKILEVKDIHGQKSEKPVEKSQKSQKKSNFNIEIVEVRNLNAQEQLHSSSMIMKPEKVEKPIPVAAFNTTGGKISLKKATKKP